MNTVKQAKSINELPLFWFLFSPYYMLVWFLCVGLSFFLQVAGWGKYDIKTIVVITVVFCFLMVFADKAAIEHYNERQAKKALMQ